MLEIVSVPSVVQGVSQLSPAVRSPSHATQSDNTWPTFDSSLQRRPPTQRIGRLIGGQFESLAVHPVNNGPGRQYVVTVGVSPDPRLTVTGIDGTPYPVYDNADGDLPSLGYLQSALTANESLRFLTIQDFTLILNKTRPILRTSDVTPSDSPNALATIFIRRGDYKARYTLRFKCAAGIVTDQAVSVRTWDGVDIANDPGCITDPNAGVNGSIRTQDIAQGFKAGIDGLALVGLTAIVTETDESSVVSVAYTGAIAFEYFRVETSSGNDDAVGYADEVDRLSKLPLIERNGRVVKIRGDVTSNADDHYVAFAQDLVAGANTIGTGHWIECAAERIFSSIDATTMPHALVRRTDFAGATYFTFERLTWDTRNVGDDNTNPFPAFVSIFETGNSPFMYISDMAFYRNRLAFISGDSVAFSEAGRYFNFWRTTVVIGPVDSDPIEIRTGDTNVADLFAAVPFNRQLVLFSRDRQYVVEAEPLLTPSTATSSTVMAYSALESCPPIALKRGLLFAHKRGGFSALNEMGPVDAANIGFDSVDLSVHVPRYAPGDAMRIIGSTQEDVVFMVTNASPQYLYVYRAHVEGQERVQSAWCRWDFGVNATVWSGAMFGSSLYLVIQRTDEVALERIDMSPGESARWTHLDRQVTDATPGVTRVYDVATGITTIALPYRTDVRYTHAAVTTAGYWFPTIPPPALIDDTPGAEAPTYTFEVRGDASAGGVVFGTLYETRQAYTKPAVFRTLPTGRVQVLDGTNWVLSGRAKFANSGPARVEVSAPDALVPETAGPHTVGGGALGAYVGSSYTIDFMIGAPSDDVTVAIVSDGPFPCNLEAVEWSIDYVSSGRRSA